jgi:hypothetical protein
MNKPELRKMTNYDLDELESQVGKMAYEGEVIFSYIKSLSERSANKGLHEKNRETMEKLVNLLETIHEVKVERILGEHVAEEVKSSEVKQ